MDSFVKIAVLLDNEEFLQRFFKAAGRVEEPFHLEWERHNVRYFTLTRNYARSGGRRSRLVRPFEKNLNLTIIGPT